MKVVVGLDDERVDRRDVPAVGQEVLAVRVEHGHAVFGAVEGHRVMASGHNSGHGLELQLPQEGSNLGGRGLASADDRLAGDEAGPFRVGDDAFETEVVAEDFVEEDAPLQVFAGRGLAHEGHAEPALRAFSDAELAVDDQAAFDGELEIALAAAVEEYGVLGSAASDTVS